MKTMLLVAALACWSAGAAGAWAAGFDHSHATFAPVLKRAVKDGLVDYAALKADPQALVAYLDQLGTVPEARFMKFSEKEKIAFLINLYNASTLKLVIDHYPLRSIKDIGNWLNGPFDQKFVRLLGRTGTLADIEHGILRRNHAEPRVHFALVCASLGCPALRDEPFTPDRLDAQLDDQARHYLNSKSKGNFVDLKSQTVSLAKIFKWFDKDFSKKSGSVLEFIAPYLPADQATALRQPGFRILYAEYDWALNDLKPGTAP